MDGCRPGHVAHARADRPTPGSGRRTRGGCPAELTLYDPSAGGVFTKDDLHGRSDNSPYLGRPLPGHVQWTFHAGRATVAEGVLTVGEVAA